METVIAKLSNNPAVPISLKQMMTFGENITEDKLLQAGNFVSLCHFIRDISNKYTDLSNIHISTILVPLIGKKTTNAKK